MDKIPYRAAAPVLVASLALILQGFGAAPARAQAVQLPTYRYFTVRTTVVAPDSGRAALGGVNRGAMGRTARGVPLIGQTPVVDRAGQAVGSGVLRHCAGMQARAEILRSDEMEDALLEQAAARRGFPQRGQAAAADVLLAGPPASVDAIAAGALETSNDDAAQALLERGRQAVADGKPGVARNYFRLAAKQGSEEVRAEALLELEQARQPPDRLVLDKP